MTVSKEGTKVYVLVYTKTCGCHSVSVHTSRSAAIAELKEFEETDIPLISKIYLKCELIRTVIS